MRRALVLLCALVGAIVAPAVANAQTAPNLTGEVFIENPAVPPTLHSINCQPDGTSSWTYTMTGIALGPFPGVVSETATIQVGPLTAPAPEIPFGLSAGTVVDMNVTFNVDGPAGTVNGIKLFQFVTPENLGTCAEASAAIVTGEICDYVQASGDRLAYHAQIDTAEGTFFDEGESALAMSALACSLTPGQGSLDETFVSSVASAPGHASGGGMIDSVSPELRVTFGFSAKTDLSGPSGHCSVVRHRSSDDPTRSKVKCLDVTAYAQVLDTAIFSGNAEVDGVATTYTIEVTDGGQNGEDTFSIETGNGFVAAGVVTRGNVRVD